MLYALVASLRSKPAKPLVRFEGLPGEFSQHDFGQVEVEFRNGASQRILKRQGKRQVGLRILLKEWLLR